MNFRTAAWVRNILYVLGAAAVLGLGIVSFSREDDSLLWVGIASGFALTLMGMMLSRRFYRCPSCGEPLAGTFTPARCPRCGAPLTK